MAVKLGQRVLSDDYGRGTVVALGPSEVHIHWDEPYTRGGKTHLLAHDLRFAEHLTELATGDDGEEAPAP